MDPVLGPTYLCKVNIADIYMKMWVRLEDVPSIAFIIPKRNSKQGSTSGFPPLHLHGIHGVCRLFYTDTRIVKDRALETSYSQSQPFPRPLETLADYTLKYETVNLLTLDRKQDK